MNWKNYLSELQRRHVVKAGIAYLVTSWLIIQVLSILFPAFQASSNAMKTTIIILGVGFPIWLIIAWVYDFSAEGIKKTEAVTYDPEVHAKKNVNLNRFIIGGLSIAVILLAVNTVRLSNKLELDEDGKVAIAVLPFANFSPDPENEWIGDGVTEDLLTQLSKIEDFRVISRTSVMQYKNQNKSIPQIAKELGVTHLLEGSVRVSKNEVLVTAQLVDSKDNHVWADNFRDKSNNIFDLQADVAKATSKAIFGKLTNKQEQRIDSVQDIDPEARKYFVWGNRIFDTMVFDKWPEAEKFYEKAIAIEPSWDQPLAALAYLKVWNNLEKGNALAEKALELNPRSDQAAAAKAVFFFRSSRVDAGISFLEEFLKNKPDSPWCHDYLASMLLSTYVPDHFDPKKALRHASKAVRMDPNSQIFARKQIFALIELEEFEKADSILSLKAPVMNEEAKASLELTKIAKLSRLKAHEHKDYGKTIEILKTTVATTSLNKPAFLIELAIAYDNYFNDKKKFLEYSQAAWENREGLIETDYFSLSSLIFYRTKALLDNGNYEEAREFLSSNEIKEIIAEVEFDSIFIDWSYFFLAIYNQDFETAKKYVNGDQYLETVLSAKVGQRKRTFELLANSLIEDKIMAFAILKEEDSLFHYLNKDFEPTWINSAPELDPYRKDPRYIAFRKKHYLQDVSIE